MMSVDPLKDEFPDFGILTAARPVAREVTQAVGLALSLELKYPGLPRAIVCNKKALQPEQLGLVKEHFDHIIEERADIHGWYHKLYLDEYTPFQQTLFLDSDMLVVCDILPWIRKFHGSSFTYWGVYREQGQLWEGPDIGQMLARIGRTRFPSIRGGGHCYFRKDTGLLAHAREIARPDTYREIAGPFLFTDETAAMLAMAIEDMPIDTSEEFFVASMDPFIRKGKVVLNCAQEEFEITSNGLSSSVTRQRNPWNYDNQKIRAAAAHFIGNRDNLIYYRTLKALFRQFPGRRLPDLPNDFVVLAIHADRIMRDIVRHRILHIDFKVKK